ncbi:MAG: glycosyltransferase [Bacteroidia bacterium]|nr:glycosyltransferase [Bacteroidia bacterium]
MLNPLISLITVTFNAEQLLAQTWQSAMNQTYQNFELILIDGGSSDNTLQVAKKFENKIGTIISEPDKGIYDAMNKGIKAAKGEWVYFLNAGDSFYNNEVLASIFENKNQEDFELIYGKVQTINEPTGVNYINGKKVTFSDFFSHYPICHQATFTHVKAFKKIGFYNINYKLVSDNTWFALFFKNQANKAIFIDKIIAFYDIQGATYQKRMQGYKEYIHFGWNNFPLLVAIKNWLMYPVIWLKVKLIRTFTNTAIFKFYRKLKFRNKKTN